jgi:predicted Zn-dependent protease
MRNEYKRLAVIGAAIIAGLVLAIGFMPSPCKAQEVRTIKLPGDATTAEQGAMIYAIREWNRALNGVLEIRTTQGRADWRVEWALGGMSGAAPPHVPSVSTMDAMHVQQGRGCKAADAEEHTGLIRIFVHCMPPGGLAAKMVHELGHLIGLGHAVGTTMDPECCFYAGRVDEATARAALNALKAVRQ